MPRTRRTSPPPSSPSTSNGTDVGRAVSEVLRGAGEIALELGSTATSAMRGSLRTVEQIGGDLYAVTRSAIEGSLESAGRITAVVDRTARRMLSMNGAPRSMPRRPVTHRSPRSRKVKGT